MAASAPFVRIQAGTTQMMDGLMDLVKDITTRHDALQAQQDEQARAQLTENTLMRSLLDQLKQQNESITNSSGAKVQELEITIGRLQQDLAGVEEDNVKLADANARLSSSFSTMQADLAAIERMTTNFGEQAENYDIAVLKEDIEQVKDTLHGLQIKFDTPFINGLLDLAAGNRGSQKLRGKGKATAMLASKKKLPLSRQHLEPSWHDEASDYMDGRSDRRSPSSVTFRAFSSDEVAAVKESERIELAASSIKRTASQRHSETFEEELSALHKRSPSLQRKKAETNLKKASAEPVTATAFAPSKPSSLHNSLSATDVEGRGNEDLDGALIEALATRTRPTPAYATSDLSPASKDMLKNIAQDQPAVETYANLAKAAIAMPQFSPISRSFTLISPLPETCPGSRNAFSSKEQSPPLAAIQSKMSSGLSASQPVSSTRNTASLGVPAASLDSTVNARRQSTRVKKSALPPDFYDTSKLKPDDKLGLRMPDEGGE